MSNSRSLAATLALALAVGLAGSARGASPELSLDQAVAIALAGHPALAVATARVDEAAGRLVGAETYPFNPELEVEGAARIGERETTGDFSVGVSSEIELGGQRGRRTEAARADLAAARAEQLRAKRRLVAGVHLAFVSALEARGLLEVARDEAQLATQLLELARRRLGAGAGTQLSVNVASAELGRAEHAVGLATGDLAAARAGLAEAMGLPPTELPMPAGDLSPTPRPLPPLEEVLAAAETHRADLRALDALEEAARARIALARAEAWPDLRVGVFAGREAGAETLVGARLSIPLPFAQRNQGGLAEARAATARVGAQRSAARLSVAREVAVAYARYEAALTALSALRERVVGTSEENLALLQKAFAAGKRDWTDVLVMERTLFEARRALVASGARARRDRLRLDIAMGAIPLDDERPEENRR